MAIAFSLQIALLSLLLFFIINIIITFIVIIITDIATVIIVVRSVIVITNVIVSTMHCTWWLFGIKRLHRVSSCRCFHSRQWFAVQDSFSIQLHSRVVVRH